jgi:hypothetical protein
MNTSILISAVIAAGVLRCTAAGAASPPDFLHAIRLVESGDCYSAPAGNAGELGPYQFRYAVWRQHTDAPFSRAGSPFADTVAVRHYHWIARRLRMNGIEATDWNIAAAWNGGVRAVVSGRIPAPTRDYATRVVNLIERYAGEPQTLAPGAEPALAQSP